MTTDAQTHPSPRHPWLAATLATLLGPLGLLYTSSVLAICGGLLAFLFLKFIGTSAVVGMLAALICGGAAFVWATRRPDLSRWPWLARFDQPSWLKSSVLAVGMLGAAFLGTRTVHTVGGVSGQPMAPTVADGERVYIVLAPWLRGAVTRGTIVEYQPPSSFSQSRIRFGVSRVVGLPGDHVDINRGLLSVNGQPADDPDRMAALRAAGCVDETLSINRQIASDVEGSARLLPGNTVPPGTVFLVGDNRSSMFVDSRVFGPIPQSAIRGVIHPAARSLRNLQSATCRPTG